MAILSDYEESTSIDTSYMRVDSRSKWKNKKVYTYNDNNYYEILDSIKVPYTFLDKVVQPNPGKESRLDLVSYEYYNTIKLWWIIAISNDIDNPLDFSPGTVIRIPEISAIFATVLA